MTNYASIAITGWALPMLNQIWPVPFQITFSNYTYIIEQSIYTHLQQ